MTIKHWLALAAALLLFLVMYFGCETKPPRQKAIEKSRALNAESTDVQVLEREALAQLSGAMMNDIRAAEARIAEADTDSLRSLGLQELSGAWYRAGHPAISGHYAEEVAKLEESSDSWSIAGTTYTICLQSAETEKVRSFCRDRAVRAFESAISLEPEAPGPRINLALVYTEAPPSDQPMKGILMLRSLQEEFPENISVLVNLARLGIQTGQYERAFERLQQAYTLDPGDVRVICLLVEAYRGLGRAAEAEQFAAQCAAAQES